MANTKQWDFPLETTYSDTDRLPYAKDAGGGSHISSNMEWGSLKTNLTGSMVFVNSLSDLPVPVAGVITGANDTAYLFTTHVDIGANVLVSGINTAWRGLDRLTSGITSSASGAFVTATGVDLTLHDLTIVYPGGEIFNADGAGVASVFVSDVWSISCNSMGTLTDTAFSIIQSSLVTPAVSGITVVGTHFTIAVIESSIAGFSGIGLDLTTSTLGTLRVDTTGFEVSNPSAVCISGLASSANILAGGSGLVAGCAFMVTGGAAVLAGLVIDDTRYEFIRNSGLDDSSTQAFVTMHSNATFTTISSVNTPVRLAGTWAASGNILRRFEFDNLTGRLTYKGVKTITADISVATTLQTALGTDNASVYIAVNGVVQSEIKMSTIVLVGSGNSLSFPASVSLATDDYVEVWIENNSDTSNLLGSDCLLKIKR